MRRSTTATTASTLSRCATSPCTARASGPIWRFDRFCRAALTGTPITVYGDGRQTRDFTFVGDVVAATRAAAEATHACGRVYNIGGGSQVSLAQVLALIEGYAGRPLAIEHLAGERGDVRDTGADTARCAPIWASRPPCRLRTACGRSSSGRWAHARPRARARLTMRPRVVEGVVKALTGAASSASRARGADTRPRMPHKAMDPVRHSSRNSVRVEG